MITDPIWSPDGPRVAQPDNSYRWATITDTDPLRVRLDGDADGLPVTPDTVFNPRSLAVGDRVWVQFYGRRIVVLGRGSGLQDTGWVDVPITNTSVFSPYGGVADAVPRVRRIGQTVRFRGALSLAAQNSNVEGSNTIAGNLITTIPDGFRPAVTDDPASVWVCQGSADNRWSLRVFATGAAHAHRYGPAATIAASWFPFNVSWTVD